MTFFQDTWRLGIASTDGSVSSQISQPEERKLGSLELKDRPHIYIDSKQV